MLMAQYKQALNVSCGLCDRYRLSGRHRHLEGPVRPVQEAQREMRVDREVKRNSATGNANRAGDRWSVWPARALLCLCCKCCTCNYLKGATECF